ncbi:ABC transporter substrate-binding protein [Chondromyces apiculatus]|uniref:Thiamine pyrimidine synthase n=1 Tax=Chondromyces apiculatus DSM 436 TaxID=1192034 RepID=A0A017TI68_9BACT|nr:ABC transporter substrate-binding protein [Chondromyces apiculatus]EYF08547.1 Hydroxymethylpyrimidine ABC transporter [Chondromyces apiculatus DSM 436]
MPMRRRAFLLAGLSASALAACSSGSGSGAPVPGGKTAVKLALNWVPEPEFGGFYAARVSGAYDREGLDVDILGGGPGSPVVQMVATSQVEFGVAGADEILMARARGADVLPIFATFQTFPQCIMTHPSRGAKTLADVLASGTLGIEPGVPYAAWLKKKYGFDRVKTVPYDGGVAQFVASKDFAQQCFVASEPIAARRKGVEPQVFLIADEGFNPYVAVVITRASLFRDKPDLVRAFRRAAQAGWRSYLDDPKAANEVMGKLNTAMDAETFAAATEAQRPFVETAEAKQKGLGTMTRERWETLGRQLVEIGVLEKAPDIDALLAATL